VLAGLRRPALVAPSVAFGATTVAAGVVVSFVPLAVTDASGNLAVAALLTQAVAATAARWLAGRYGDRHGPAGQLVPALLAVAAGMALLVLAADPIAVMTGMLLFGAGFGVAQNASLALMFARVPSSEFGTASAIWNLAYDAGMGLGAGGFGVLAAGTGYPGAFAITAVVMLAALPAAWRGREGQDRPGT
jgi:predicted MFS family arabinose efflux permease